MAKGDDPAFGVIKTLTVNFSTDDKVKPVSGTNQMAINCVTFDSRLQDAKILADTDNNIILLLENAGRYELKTASGKSGIVHAKTNSVSKEITGSWKVFFDPVAGRRGEVTFSTLDDWSERPENGIKYYSGTAIYKTSFVVPSISKNGHMILDLGKVAVMAEVKLKGKDLGTCWKRPYQEVDVTDAIKTGENQMEIKLVNFWINRQIRDENLPDDSDRASDGTRWSCPELPRIRSIRGLKM